MPTDSAPPVGVGVRVRFAREEQDGDFEWLEAIVARYGGAIGVDLLPSIPTQTLVRFGDRAQAQAFCSSLAADGRFSGRVLPVD